jgi:hypothetical protein
MAEYKLWLSIIWNYRPILVHHINNVPYDHSIFQTAIWLERHSRSRSLAKTSKILLLK